MQNTNNRLIKAGMGTTLDNEPATSFSKSRPISNNKCPKCGGKRVNEESDLKYGHCSVCGIKWFVIKGDLVS